MKLIRVFPRRTLAESSVRDGMSSGCGKLKAVKDRCWQCGKKLVLPYFAEIKDHDGNAIRVHKVCKILGFSRDLAT
jgi:hypothetical protein